MLRGLTREKGLSSKIVDFGQIMGKLLKVKSDFARKGTMDRKCEMCRDSGWVAEC